MDVPQAESSIYHCTQHEPVVLSPELPAVPTEQQKTVEDLKQQVADLKAIVETLLNSKR